MILSVWTLPLFLALSVSGCTVFLSTNGTRVRSVQITPANPTIAVGGKQQFTANVTFGDGTLIQVGPVSVIWASSNPAVATININGVAIGLSPGTTLITGSFENVGGSTALTVTTPFQVRLLVSGSASRMEVTYLGSRQGYLYVSDPLTDTTFLYQVDLTTGQESFITSVSVAPAHGPTWMTLDPSGKFLYVGNHGSADISAFSINPETGHLTTVAGSPFQTESIPWSISVAPDGRLVSVTYFDSPAISLFRIDPVTGALTSERQP